MATNTLLIGLPGSGKTYALAEVIEAGHDLFVIFTEPGGEDSILEAIQERGLDGSKFHYTYVPAVTASWTSLMKAATDVNKLDQKALQSAKPIRTDYGQLIDLLSRCHNFTDQNGEEFGDISTWDESRFLAIDGLSGLSRMALDLVCGPKVIKTIADWGMAMNQLETILTKFTHDIPCHFCLIGHLELERDEVQGKIEKMPSTLGKKLPAQVGKYFSDVILAEKKGDKYTWSTAATDCSTKSRNLPDKVDLAPSFKFLIESWAKKRPENQTQSS